MASSSAFGLFLHHESADFSGGKPLIRLVRGFISAEAEGQGPAVVQEMGGRWERRDSPQEFLTGLGEDPPDAVVVSLGPQGADRPFVEKVIQALGGVDRVLLSAPGASLELALAARELGAGTLLHEPLIGRELKQELRRRAPVEQGVPIDPSASSPGPGSLVGSSRAMAQVVRTIVEVGDSPATVLLTGESGTGKELVARAIHRVSSRRDGPFVAINCAAIPEQLLESEFFGHERGAFTGAVARKLGRFERAHEGTLFLDEVGDMSVLLQAKLLRALEEREIERVGGEAGIPVDVRVIAATNRALDEKVEEGGFREDLFYRLAVVLIDIPPLRERMEDVKELTLHFAAAFARQYGVPLEGVEGSALRLLRAHSWPGNVRELRNVVERAVRTSRGGWIRAEDVVLGDQSPRLSSREERPSDGYPPTRSLEEVEREHIARVLSYTGGVMGEAADILGIHRNTLTRKVDQYDLREGDEAI